MQLLWGQQVENSITKLLEENPDAPVPTVLADSDLQNSIRYEIPQLIRYITKTENLTEVLKWGLTREYADVENSFRLARSAVAILSSNSKALQEKLHDNELFINTLVQCQKNNLEDDLQLCGHFQRIIEAYVRYTNGGFLEHFPGLCSYLIQRSHIVALRVLLVRLMTDFSQAFSDEKCEEPLSLPPPRSRPTVILWFVRFVRLPRTNRP